MRDETWVVRAGLTAAVAGEPLHGGPVFVSPYHLSGNVAGNMSGNRATDGYTYGRAANPGWTELEDALGGLEGNCAGVRVFGSGMAAVFAAMACVLRAGETVVLLARGYFGSQRLLEEVLAPLGVAMRLVKEFTEETIAGARLVWVETPSNPLLAITDVAAIVALAHTAGAMVAVDNTTASPLGQKPLVLGADLSVCSDSKSICGHSDLILGHVAVRDRNLLARLDQHRTLTGGIAGPMEAWLALRSLATAGLRIERSSANALGIASFLSGHSAVEAVYYPGLAEHLGHVIAARQMRYFGPVIGFTLRDRAAAESFLRKARLVTEATSFGGITTTAERRGRWGHDRVAEGFLRLSAGCEALDDLLEDLEEALA